MLLDADFLFKAQEISIIYGWRQIKYITGCSGTELFSLQLILSIITQFPVLNLIYFFKTIFLMLSIPLQLILFSILSFSIFGCDNARFHNLDL